MVSVEYSEAIVEILDILNNSDETIYNKIPKKLIEFWQRNKSETYKPNLDHSKKLTEMNLKEKTKSIIAMIYLNYLCDEDEKKETILILKNNENAYQKEIREKYNPDNIFKNTNKEVMTEQNINITDMVKYKKSIILRIIDFIKRFLKK